VPAIEQNVENTTMTKVVLNFGMVFIYRFLGEHNESEIKNMEA
jgi:hypothetical protein